MKIELIPVCDLLHIERHSTKRMRWLEGKIKKEGVWSKPIAVDDQYGLVLDGQHRMEVAKRLDLKHIPAIKFCYADVNIRSLRSRYSFDWEEVTMRAINGDIYPYKTVKHDFSEPLPKCQFTLEQLK